MTIARVFQLKKKNPFTFQFTCWSKFAFILSLDIYCSVQVMWGTLTASLLGLLLRSWSQESICNRFPFHLSPPAAAVEHIERKPRCTSCVWVTSCSALVPGRNELGTKVLTCISLDKALVAASLCTACVEEILEKSKGLGGRGK